MFIPPFTLSNEALNLLTDICSALPAAQAEKQISALTVADIQQAHTQCGGSGILRNSGNKPHWVPALLNALLSWQNSTETHPIIRSAVFHYEFMSIYPFSGGNEVLAMKLHQAMLAEFHPQLAGIPLAFAQQEYKWALSALDASDFIMLSLRCIHESLKHRTPATLPETHKLPAHAEQLVQYLRQHPGSKRQDILNALPALSARMLDRHLQTLRDSGQIEYRGSRKTGAYYPCQQTHATLENSAFRGFTNALDPQERFM